MDVDWQKATNPEKQALYRACKVAMFKRRMDWTGLWRAVFKEEAVGEGWERNFAAGRLAVLRIAMFSDWLTDNEPALAESVARDIAALRDAAAPMRAWEEFLAQSARIGCIEIRQSPISRVINYGIEPPRQRVQSQSQLEIWQPSAPVQRVPVGIPFSIELEHIGAGVAYAFQETKGSWLPFSLHADGRAGVELTAGLASLPVVPREADPVGSGSLYVEYEQGMHRLVILVVPAAFANVHVLDLNSDAQTTATFLEKLVIPLKALDDAWTIDLCHVLFVA